MSWSNKVRQFHRWMSVVFTVAVIVTTIVLAQDQPPVWVSYLALPPLFLLWFTGMYLFVLPHVVKRRGGERAQT
jgi:hypothetical protein